MNFATTKDNALNAIGFFPLQTYLLSGNDHTKRGVAYVSDRTVTATVYENYSSTKTVAPVGNIVVSGSWIIK